MIRFVQKKAKSEALKTSGLRVGIFRDGEYSCIHPDNSFFNGLNVTNQIEFSKVYQHAPRCILRDASKNIIWDWPAGRHIRRGELTPGYHMWRSVGLEASVAVRNPAKCALPVGYHTPDGQWMTPLGFRLTWEIPTYYNSTARNSTWSNVLNLSRCHIPITIVTRSVPDSDYLDVDEVRRVLRDVSRPFPWPYVLAMQILSMSPRDI